MDGELRRLIELANRRMKPDRIVVGTPEGDRALEELLRLFGEEVWGTAPAWGMDSGRPDEPEILTADPAAEKMED